MSMWMILRRRAASAAEPSPATAMSALPDRCDPSERQRARQTRLCGEPDWRVDGTIAAIASPPLDDLEEQTAAQGLRIEMGELGAVLAVVEQIAGAQAIDPRVVEIGARR